MTDTGQSESHNYGYLCKCPRRYGGPCGAWDEKNAICDRTDRNKIEGDGSGNGCADETQSKRFRTPYCSMVTCSARFYGRIQQKQKRTQEIIQDEVNGSDQNDDTSGYSKQVLGLEIPPGDVIETVRGQPQE